MGLVPDPQPLAFGVPSPRPSIHRPCSTLSSALASAPQAGTLCDPYTFAAFVQCLKGICLPSRAAKDIQATQQSQADGAGPSQANDAAACPVSPSALLEDVGAFLKQHSMRGSPDMVALLLDALVDITASPLAGGGRPAAAGKRGGAAARQQYSGTSLSPRKGSWKPSKLPFVGRSRVPT